MPLHDWQTTRRWDGLRSFWLGHIARDLRTRLPPGYRALLDVAVMLAGDDFSFSDVAATPPPSVAESVPAFGEPDAELVARWLDEELIVTITSGSRLVTAIELVSPRNKDRPSSRERYARTYAGYLEAGVHLLVVDVHPWPTEFSFGRAIAEALGGALPSIPAPGAVTYRVGEPVPQGGRLVAVWNRPLVVGEPLPTMPVPLTVHESVPLDLEATYMLAASDTYLA